MIHFSTFGIYPIYYPICDTCDTSYLPDTDTMTVNTTKHYMIYSCYTMFAKTTRHYTIFTDSLCKSTKKKGIHKRNDAKSESPGTDPNFLLYLTRKVSPLRLHR